MEQTGNKLSHKGNTWNWTQFQKWVGHENSPRLHAPSTLVIKPETKVFAMGSCFAQNVTKYLRKHGVPGAHSYPETIHFNPVSIAQEVKHLLDSPQFSENDLWQANDGRFGHPFRRPTLRTPSKAELWNWSTDVENQARALLKSADLVAMTLGGTECWRHPVTKKVYLTIPYPDMFNDQMPGVAEFHRITYAETQKALEESYQLIRRSNPNAHILFTVSPNRLTFTCSGDDVVTATSHGKAVLRAALGEWIESKKKGDSTTTGDSKIHYFNSYEIVTYAKHPEDLLDDHQEHVNDFAVSVVMTQFMKNYASPELQNPTELKMVQDLLKNRDIELHVVRGRKQRRFKTRVIRLLRFLNLEEAAMAFYHLKVKKIFKIRKFF